MTGPALHIGISHSKTQAKLANYFAKKQHSFQSVCNLLKLDLCSHEQPLMETSAAEIWGIGRKTGKKLAGYHIQNASDLPFANAHHPARLFPALTALAIRELNGQSCIALDDPELPQQQLLSSRSFFTALCDKSIIQQAVIFHINRTYKHLTAQGLLCAAVHVLLYEKIPNPPYKKAFPML